MGSEMCIRDRVLGPYPGYLGANDTRPNTPFDKNSKKKFVLRGRFGASEKQNKIASYVDLVNTASGTKKKLSCY